MPEAGQFIIENESLAERLSERLKQFNLHNPQIVMEIVEQKSHNDLSLKKVTNQLSNIGFHIAVDDFGSNASTPERVALLSPDIIKFDRNLLQKYMTGDRLPLLRAVQVARRAKAKTVIEGVESQQQFEAMKQLNINMYQGYYLGTPEGLMSKAGLAYG